MSLRQNVFVLNCAFPTVVSTCYLCLMQVFVEGEAVDDGQVDALDGVTRRTGPRNGTDPSEVFGAGSWEVQFDY